MRERFDAGTAIVALGAIVLLVSLFLDWYQPGADAWAVFESLDLVLAGAAVFALVSLAPRFAALAAWLPLVASGALVVVAVQLLDPPPAARGAGLDTGAWVALAATALMALGALLAAARISVTVDVRARERRRRAAAIDAREGAAAPDDAEAAPPDEDEPAAGRLFARESSRDDEDEEPETQRTEALDPVDPDEEALTRAMSAVVSELRFEVRRFAASPAGADVGLLELEGRFRAAARRRLGRPSLVAEGEGEPLEVRPVAATDAVAGPDAGLWRATFAVPLEALGAGRFSLAVGRELLLELPAPDGPPADGDGADRHVRLAREANALRRRADDARDAAGAALARADAATEARERAEDEADALRLERDDLTRRLASVESELGALRREQAEERVAHDETLRSLTAAHEQASSAAQAEHSGALQARDAAAAQAIEEGVSAARADAAEARRALKAARGDLEAARREADRQRELAGRAAAAVPRGYVTREPDADDAAAAEPAAGPGADETVRVLGEAGARPRRRRARDDTPATEPLPGTAAIGARHIEPGVTGVRSAVAVWIARIFALACIAAVVVALALLLRGL